MRTAWQKVIKKIGGESLGESLMEVIVAVSMLMIVIVPAGALYLSTTKNSDIQKKMLIADQLAAEGLDLVRAVRDTNLLLYRSKESQCWLTKTAHGNSEVLISFDTCQANIMTSGSYTIEAGKNGIEMIRRNNENALSGDLNAQADDLFLLKLTAGNNPKYTYGAGTPSGYYREIDLVLQDVDGVAGIDAVNVTSRVKFKVGSKVQQAVMSSVLFMQ